MQTNLNLYTLSKLITSHIINKLILKLKEMDHNINSNKCQLTGMAILSKHKVLSNNNSNQSLIKRKYRLQEGLLTLLLLKWEELFKILISMVTKPRLLAILNFTETSQHFKTL